MQPYKTKIARNRRPLFTTPNRAHRTANRRPASAEGNRRKNHRNNQAQSTGTCPTRNNKPVTQKAIGKFDRKLNLYQSCNICAKFDTNFKRRRWPPAKSVLIGKLSVFINPPIFYMPPYPPNDSDNNQRDNQIVKLLKTGMQVGPILPELHANKAQHQTPDKRT